jgi:hypothetical protein
LAKNLAKKFMAVQNIVDSGCEEWNQLNVTNRRAVGASVYTTGK